MYPDYELFELKEEHITLLSKTYITWNNTEAGAPEINPKRPYGNSYIIGDLAELMGATKEDGNYTDEEYNRLFQFHYETQYALNIILETKQFNPGTYIRKRFSGDWSLINETNRNNQPNAIDLNQKINDIIKKENEPYRMRTIKELERLGLDGLKLAKFDYNELTKLLERRRVHYRSEEEKKLDQIIEELLLPNHV